MIPLLTLADAVATHARLQPNKLAVRDSRRHLTYRAWDERATLLAAVLSGLGLAKGDRVGVIAYNCLEWMEIYAGMARAGLVVVPINFRLSGTEMAYILDHAAVAAVVAVLLNIRMVNRIKKNYLRHFERIFGWQCDFDQKRGTTIWFSLWQNST